MRYFRRPLRLRPFTKQRVMALFAGFLVITFLYSKRNVSIKDFLKTITRTGDYFGCNYDYEKYNLEGRQDDPCLIDIVRNQFIVPPSALPYNLNNTIGSKSNPDIPCNREKVRILKKYLIDKVEPGYQGFFVDCGANDGEFLSSTIKLEQDFGWSGLLVEANPDTYTQLRSKNRKAWSINAGACITPYAQKITLFTNPRHSGLSSLSKSKKRGVEIPKTIQCIPLYTMLAAINVTTVDFLNLDVEGLELAILQTIPFDKIQFKVLIIEYKHIPGGLKALEKFLNTKDYVYVKKMWDYFTGDSLFVHKSLKDTFQSEFVKVPERSATVGCKTYNYFQ